MVPRPLNFSPRVSSSYSDGSTSRVIREDVSSIRARKGAAVELENWGYPGHLTDVECDVYVSKGEKNCVRCSGGCWGTTFSLGFEICSTLFIVILLVFSEEYLKEYFYYIYGILMFIHVF